MATIEDFIIGFIMSGIAIIVGITLLPTVNDTITTAAVSLPATQGTILSLVTLLITFGMVVFVIRTFVKK